MAMFIRVKRKKTTYFLHCDPTETILEIKQKIQALSENPVHCQRLILMSTQQILDDNKTLADQKTVQTKSLGEPGSAEADKACLEEQLTLPTADFLTYQNDQGFQGVLLKDGKTLAEQQVENDAIVALCLKISDPRTHRIQTLMRHPILLSTRSPTPTPPEVAEEIILAPGEEPPPLPPPSPEHRMSTELRVPHRPPKEEKDTEDVGKQGSLGGVSSKDTTKKGTQKEGLKKEVKKEISKKEVKKETAMKDITKKEVSKKETDKKLGKETSGKGGKQSSKKGSRKGPKEEVPPPEEPVGPLEDGGVWEDITIDKLTDYSSLVDSD